MKNENEKGATRGASGGGDDPQDLRFPDAPTDTSDQRRKWWERTGARPKGPGYQPIPTDIPMSENKGLPPSKGGPKTAETSFIEGIPSGRVRNADSLKIELAHHTIEKEYPQYGKDGKFFTLVVEEGKVFVVGPKGGLTRLFLANGRDT